MEKLKNLLFKWTYANRKGIIERPKNISLFLVDAMWKIAQELERDGKAYFFIDDLAPYLKKCGFKVTPPHDEELNYIAERIDEHAENHRE